MIPFARDGHVNKKRRIDSGSLGKALGLRRQGVGAAPAIVENVLEPSRAIRRAGRRRNPESDLRASPSCSRGSSAESLPPGVVDEDFDEYLIEAVMGRPTCSTPHIYGRYIASLTSIRTLPAAEHGMQKF